MSASEKPSSDALCVHAVQEGRQVALLVPTTVLAQQHCDSFLERMAALHIHRHDLPIPNPKTTK